MSKLY